ncbi:MAG: ATP-binding protein [Pseudomonadota bacterium]
MVVRTSTASAARRILSPFRASSQRLDFAQVLGALPDAVLVVDDDLVIRYVNEGALNFFQAPETTLVAHPISQILPEDSPVVHLVRQVFDRRATVSESGVMVESARIEPQQVTLTIGPIGDGPNQAVITLHPISLARRIDRQLSRRNASRSVSAMAGMLAHEVKNPLSGIRGAAQLLGQTIGDEDRRLTSLICQESDRIVRLVNRMEVFADGGTMDRKAVNIHSALEQVRKVAQNGFGKHVRFVEHYDPSLPPVFGNRDQLIQLFLNLVKNASEAAPQEGGEVTLSTAFQRGVSVVAPGANRATLLPLRVTVEDNGGGIPSELRDHLFDPFITTKKKGSGLGLALVAKVVGDHGGVIELDSNGGRTAFKVSLPIASGDARPAMVDDQEG